MLSTNMAMRLGGYQITAGNYTSDVIKECVYLDMDVAQAINIQVFEKLSDLIFYQRSKQVAINCSTLQFSFLNSKFGLFVVLEKSILINIQIKKVWKYESIFPIALLS